MLLINSTDQNHEHEHGHMARRLSKTLNSIFINQTNFPKEEKKLCKCLHMWSGIIESEARFNGNQTVKQFFPSFCILIKFSLLTGKKLVRTKAQTKFDFASFKKNKLTNYECGFMSLTTSSNHAMMSKNEEGTTAISVYPWHVITQLHRHWGGHSGDETITNHHHVLQQQ